MQPILSWAGWCEHFGNLRHFSCLSLWTQTNGVFLPIRQLLDFVEVVVMEHDFICRCTVPLLESWTTFWKVFFSLLHFALLWLSRNSLGKSLHSEETLLHRKTFLFLQAYQVVPRKPEEQFSFVLESMSLVKTGTAKLGVSVIWLHNAVAQWPQ